MMLDMLGSLGWYCTASTTLFVDFLSTFLIMSVRLSSDAFLIAAFTTFLLYFHVKSIFLNSDSLCPKVSLLLQIRTNLSAKE